MKFNKGDCVRINCDAQGYNLELGYSYGIVVHSNQATTFVMFQCHDNPFTVDRTYEIPTCDLKLEPRPQIWSDIPTNFFSIKKVIFNNPATIVFWDDGSKTVVKCGEYDIFDPEKGLSMAISKKALGNQGNYYETFKKHVPEDLMEEAESVNDPEFFGWLYNMFLGE